MVLAKSDKVLLFREKIHFFILNELKVFVNVEGSFTPNEKQKSPFCKCHVPFKSYPTRAPVSLFM
jgi:hypothetical protein